MSHIHKYTPLEDVASFLDFMNMPLNGLVDYRQPNWWLGNVKMAHVGGDAVVRTLNLQSVGCWFGSLLSFTHTRALQPHVANRHITKSQLFSL